MPSPADDPVWVWGLPLAPVTFDQALDRIDRLIEDGEPSFFITANLNYAMLADADPRLRALNDRAAFLLADGMPLVWWSRLGPRPLPERVAGSDLIYGMCERAARNGHRVYLLGAAPGVADEAAAKLVHEVPRPADCRRRMPAVPQADVRGGTRTDRAHPGGPAGHPVRGVWPAEGRALDRRAAATSSECRCACRSGRRSTSWPAGSDGRRSGCRRPAWSGCTGCSRSPGGWPGATSTTSCSWSGRSSPRFRRERRGSPADAEGCPGPANPPRQRGGGPSHSGAVSLTSPARTADTT